MSFIGYINCDRCNTQYIEDPDSVTVWYNDDNDQQLADVVCPQCHEISSDRIDLDTLYVFKMAGCHFKPFNDKFAPLTEDEIALWDINDELADIII